MNEDGEWGYLVSFGNDGDDESIVDLAPAPEGGVYVLMEYSDEITVNETTFYANSYSCGGCISSGAQNTNILLIRINEDGTEEWTVQFGNYDTDNAWSMDVDSNYNVNILASKWGRVQCSSGNPCNNVWSTFWNSDGSINTWNEAKGGVYSVKYSSSGFYSDVSSIFSAYDSGELCENSNGGVNYCITPKQIKHHNGSYYHLFGLSGNYGQDEMDISTSIPNPRR